MFWQRSPELREPDVDRVVKSFACNDVAKRSTLVHFRAMLAPGFFADYERWIDELTESVPAKVLWGSNDPYLPDEYAHRFGRAQVKVVPNGGHWLAITQPALVAHAIRDVTPYTVTS